jgi:hypothetical protein
VSESLLGQVLVGRMSGIDLRVTPIALADNQFDVGYDGPKTTKNILKKKKQACCSSTLSPIFLNACSIIRCTSAFKDPDIWCVAVQE